MSLAGTADWRGGVRQVGDVSPVCCSCAERGGKARGGTGGLGAYGLEAVGVVADGLAGDPGFAGDGVEADCRGVVGDPAVCCDRPARRVWVARLWTAATRCWELSDCIGRPSRSLGAWSVWMPLIIRSRCVGA